MRIHHSIVDLKLLHPFKIARRAVDEYRQVVSVEIDGGLGEAPPARFYGETVETVGTALDILASGLDGNLDAIQTVMAELQSALGGNYAAKSAIDMALHDRLGKALGVPLYRLWGLDPNATPPTSYTIGLDTPNVMQQKTREAEDFAILKVKLGTPQDVQIIRALREVTDKPIYVDANTAWSPKEAVRKIRELAPLGVDIVEQPTAADDLEGLKYIREHSDVPIIADESVKRAADIPALADCVDGVNIKLVKCGGLLEAMRIISVARAHKLKVMMGCMIESSLGITAAAHLTPLVDYVDLDSHLLIANDPYSGVTLKNGKLVLPDRPGIGVVQRAVEQD
ncbi:MAG: dipeptide epimerase [Candidatus Poribacteria bacterium]|nr:dipeptide epimerase [Candidatus Poribacteria bacterium]